MIQNRILSKFFNNYIIYSLQNSTIDQADENETAHTSIKGLQNSINNNDSFRYKRINITKRLKDHSITMQTAVMCNNDNFQSNKSISMYDMSNLSMHVNTEVEENRAKFGAIMGRHRRVESVLHQKEPLNLNKRDKIVSKRLHTNNDTKGFVRRKIRE